MKTIRKISALLLTAVLCIALCVPAMASSGFNAGLEITKTEGQITVTVQDSQVLHEKVPTLSIPADAAFEGAKLLFDGVASTVTYADGAVSFKVAKGGTYYIVIGAVLVETVSATCGETGRNVYLYNSGNYIETLAATEDHSYTEKVSSQKASDATCTEAAIYYVQCDNCTTVSDSATVLVGSPNGHDFTDTGKETCANCSVENPNYEAPYVPPYTPPSTPSVTPDPEPAEPETPSEPENPVVDTTVTENEDGSTTITETKADGTVVETTQGTDGSSTKVETKTEVVETEEGTVTTTTTTTETELANGIVATTTKNAEGEVSSNVQIPAEVTSQVIEAGESVILPIPAVSATKDIQAAPVITVATNSDEKVSIEIPVEDVTAGTVVVIVDQDGNETVVKNSVVTENGVVADLPDGATVKVIDNAKDFGDVREGSWYSDAVDFASSRELFHGVDDAGNFAPNGEMTRGMLLTVLARLDGQDTTPEKGQHWQTPGVEWAVKNGLSDGTNPSDSITREQIAVMLWRYAGSPVSEGDLGGFTDGDEAGSWAAEALKWAVENGVMNGVGNQKLDPKGYADRAQVAQFLKNFIENVM